MDYPTLTGNIQQYLENSFSTAQLATIVQQAEHRIYNAVQLAVMRKTDTSMMLTAGQSTLNAPSDFIAPYALSLFNAATGAYQQLLIKDRNYIREAYPIPANTGSPRVYAITGGTADKSPLTFMIGPSADTTYTVEFEYFHYPQSIVTATNTWLGDNYDTVLLAGCLLEGYIFMKGEEDMMKVYQQNFTDALAQLKRLADGQQRGDAYQYGQFRGQVN